MAVISTPQERAPSTGVHGFLCPGWGPKYRAQTPFGFLVRGLASVDDRGLGLEGRWGLGVWGTSLESRVNLYV